MLSLWVMVMLINTVNFFSIITFITIYMTIHVNIIIINKIITIDILFSVCSSTHRCACVCEYALSMDLFH